MELQSRPSTLEESLRNLRQLPQAAPQFWARCAHLILSITHGAEAFLLQREPGAQGQLRPVAQARRKASPEAETIETFAEFALLAEKEGSASGLEVNGSRQSFIATRLAEIAGGQMLAVVRLGEATEDRRARSLELLEMAVAAVAVEQLSEQAAQAREETRAFASILDLMVLLEEETRFGAAAMLFCNQIATRFEAERASLGLVHGHEIQVEAISHADRFERKAAAVKALAVAMEEALDQDEEIVCPPEPEQTSVTRCHEAYARTQEIAHLASIPLRKARAALGVLTLERSARAFSLGELRRLRLIAEHAGRRLGELRERDRWWGARLASHWRRQAARLLGPEHTGYKLAALGGVAALLVLALAKGTYRVDAPFTLRSDRVAFLSAPFDGYIDQVLFRLGDRTEVNQALVTLGTDELRLDESAALAEQNSFLSEAQKAQSANLIAEMQINLFKAQEVKARLERIRFHLGQAKVLAPLAGIVVEGDLRERVGAPVKQGEVLLKLARLADLYVDAQVNERNIGRLTPGAAGEVAFAAQPKWKFPVRVERVEPAANVTEKGNNFAVRLTLATAPEAWWRPGMTGVCKIEAGRHSLLWIITHRTVEFLRLYLWW